MLRQYHKTVLSLFMAFLPTLEPPDPRFAAGATSAACVCNAYKRLNQQKILSYTMMALHSCFVAGLTLVYCLWKDRSLFSYDALEATRACSQCLTIFGEKWPGAVKYRDIFDALSGSLFKTIVSPASGANGQAPYPLEITWPAEAESPEEPRMGNEATPPQNASKSSESVKPNFNGMIHGAVKDAFMEVDDEAPGGWHAWRMFNQMVQGDNVEQSGRRSIDNMNMGLYDDGETSDDDSRINDAFPSGLNNWDTTSFTGLN
jgi:hypothetical protein